MDVACQITACHLPICHLPSATALNLPSATCHLHDLPACFLTMLLLYLLPSPSRHCNLLPSAVYRLPSAVCRLSAEYLRRRLHAADTGTCLAAFCICHRHLPP
jgi:hypothetical protein